MGNVHSERLVSPSGRMTLEWGGSTLQLTGEAKAGPVTLAAYVLPFVAVAVYLFTRRLWVPTVVGCLLLLYAAYLLNIGRRRTTLTLAGDAADWTEAGFLFTSGTRVRLDPAATTVETIHTEDGPIFCLRLKVRDEPDLRVLKNHTEEDLHWLCHELEAWRGKPHNPALNPTGLRPAG